MKISGDNACAMRSTREVTNTDEAGSWCGSWCPHAGEAGSWCAADEERLPMRLAVGVAVGVSAVCCRSASSNYPQQPTSTSHHVAPHFRVVSVGRRPFAQVHMHVCMCRAYVCVSAMSPLVCWWVRLYIACMRACVKVH